MRTQLPGGYQADRIVVTGSAMICICGQITHVYHIGKHSIELYGTFTRLVGRGEIHIHAIEDQYICVCQDGTWVFHEFIAGLPVSHSCKLNGYSDDDDGKQLSKAVLNNTADCYIVGVGSHNNDSDCVHDGTCSPTMLDVYLYRMSTRTVFAQTITLTGTLIDYDDCGNLLYFDVAAGVPTLWRYRAAPMPIDVLNMLVKTSDPQDNATDHVTFTCQRHGMQMRFIIASGYLGAVEINTLTRVCRTIWTNLHVFNVVTADRIEDCIVYDICSNQYWTDNCERNVSAAVTGIIAAATKNSSDIVERASIAMPGHIAAQDSHGNMFIINLNGVNGVSGVSGV